MDSRGPTSVATFFSEASLEPSGTVDLEEGEAHHARVRRIEPGSRVRLVNGAGVIAFGALTKVTKRSASVAIDDVTHIAPPPAVHLFAPVGDRDRMLWLAEKSTELGLTSWRGVMWQRSRGVSPRGEGESFRAKLRTRMIGALTQSGGAWLPAVLPDLAAEDMYEAADRGGRFFLDVTGEPMLSVVTHAPLTIALGPEGGLADDERSRLSRAGWIPVSLGATTLRFETAGVAALAIVRAALAANVESARG
ncbi:MAG: RsmE family RNA methyltransferase [Gemmatimonadota bacterium]|nr:RsmE family RNA methyltransferase [Gemmatimonadota bacterium]